MNLRLSRPEISQSAKDKVIIDLHQCKQCGVLFEHVEKTCKPGEFSWYSRFMIDKCDICKNFRLNNAYN